MTPRATKKWVERIERLGLTDPIDIVQAAGAWAAPQRQPGVSFFSTDRALKLSGSIGESSGGRWAISGAPVLGIERGLTILHAHDVVRAVAMAQTFARQRATIALADLIVVGSPPATFLDSW